MAQNLWVVIIYDLDALLLPRFLYFRYIPAVAAGTAALRSLMMRIFREQNPVACCYLSY